MNSREEKKKAENSKSLCLFFYEKKKGQLIWHYCVSFTERTHCHKITPGESLKLKGEGSLMLTCLVNTSVVKSQREFQSSSVCTLTLENKMSKVLLLCQFFQILLSGLFHTVKYQTQNYQTMFSIVAHSQLSPHHFSDLLTPLFL